MNSKSIIQSSFQEISKIHPIWEHSFLHKCRYQELTLAEVKLLAVQMYKFCKEFNRILASILSCCEDENAQLVILKNLYDEMGQGKAEKSHPELFRQFTRALGIDDETLASLPTTPETDNLIKTYINIAPEYGYLAALGAICYSSEGIVNTLYTQLYKGIIGSASFTKESLIFFEVHIDLDTDHAKKLAEFIEPKITSHQQEIKVRQAILKTMDARVRFFDGIEHQIFNCNFAVNPLLFNSIRFR